MRLVRLVSMVLVVALPAGCVQGPVPSPSPTPSATQADPDELFSQTLYLLPGGQVSLDRPTGAEAAESPRPDFPNKNNPTYWSIRVNANSTVVEFNGTIHLRAKEETATARPSLMDCIWGLGLEVRTGGAYQAVLACRNEVVHAIPPGTFSVSMGRRFLGDGQRAVVGSIVTISFHSATTSPEARPTLFVLQNATAFPSQVTVVTRGGPLIAVTDR